MHPAASAALFNIAAHTEKQLRQFRSTALSFMIALLSGKGFMEKVRVVCMGCVRITVDGTIIVWTSL